MSEQQSFNINKLPPVDLVWIQRGKCPWCLVDLYDDSLVSGKEQDVCSECGDTFYYDNQNSTTTR